MNSGRLVARQDPRLPLLARKSLSQSPPRSAHGASAESIVSSPVSDGGRSDTSRRSLQREAKTKCLEDIKKTASQIDEEDEEDEDGDEKKKARRRQRREGEDDGDMHTYDGSETEEDEEEEEDEVDEEDGGATATKRRKRSQKSKGQKDGRMKKELSLEEAEIMKQQDTFRKRVKRDAMAFLLGFKSLATCGDRLRDMTSDLSRRKSLRKLCTVVVRNKGNFSWIKEKSATCRTEVLKAAKVLLDSSYLELPVDMRRVRISPLATAMGAGGKKTSAASPLAATWSPTRSPLRSQPGQLPPLPPSPPEPALEKKKTPPTTTPAAAAQAGASSPSKQQSRTFPPGGQPNQAQGLIAFPTFGPRSAKRPAAKQYKQPLSAVERQEAWPVTAALKRKTSDPVAAEKRIKRDETQKTLSELTPRSPKPFVANNPANRSFAIRASSAQATLASVASSPITTTASDSVPVPTAMMTLASQAAVAAAVIGAGARPSTITTGQRSSTASSVMDSVVVVDGKIPPSARALASSSSSSSSSTSGTRALATSTPRALASSTMYYQQKASTEETPQSGGVVVIQAASASLAAGSTKRQKKSGKKQASSMSGEAHRRHEATGATEPRELFPHRPQQPSVSLQESDLDFSQPFSPLSLPAIGHEDNESMRMAPFSPSYSSAIGMSQQSHSQSFDPLIDDDDFTSPRQHYSANQGSQESHMPCPIPSSPSSPISSSILCTQPFSSPLASHSLSHVHTPIRKDTKDPNTPSQPSSGVGEWRLGAEARELVALARAPATTGDKITRHIRALLQGNPILTPLDIELLLREEDLPVFLFAQQIDADAFRVVVRVGSFFDATEHLFPQLHLYSSTSLMPMAFHLAVSRNMAALASIKNYDVIFLH